MFAGFWLTLLLICARRYPKLPGAVNNFLEIFIDRLALVGDNGSRECERAENQRPRGPATQAAD